MFHMNVKYKKQFSLDQNLFFSSLSKIESERNEKLDLTIMKALIIWNTVWIGEVRSLDFNSFTLEDIEAALNAVYSIETELEDSEDFLKANRHNPMVQAFLLDDIKEHLATVKMVKKKPIKFL